MDNFDELLSAAKMYGGSDLHLIIGYFPIVRKNNLLAPLPDASENVLDESVIRAFANEFMSPYHLDILQTHGDVDVAYSFFYKPEQKTLRCRINIFRDSRGLSMACRLINDKIPAMQDIRLPLGAQQLIRNSHGLIIFTGATGSGKTTSLASMINSVNENKAVHIITIEDPIEYQFKIRKSIVSQREVGRDCSSFYQGLKASLREDPDIILVGELRDQETISTAIMAAETGHLVLTTLHTANVIEAIDRLVQYFPADAQNQVRHELAISLRGIVAQRLFNKRGGGRIAAFEVLINTPAIANLIHTNEMRQVYNYMNSRDGMQTMEDSILGLRNMRLVDETNGA